MTHIPVVKNQNFNKTMGDLTKKSSNIINKVLFDKVNRNIIDGLIENDKLKIDFKRKGVERSVVNNKKSKIEGIGNGNNKTLNKEEIIKYDVKNVKLFIENNGNHNLNLNDDESNNENSNHLSDVGTKVKIVKPAKKIDKKLKFI